MGRAAEQHASIFGHAGEAEAAAADTPSKPVQNQPRFSGMPDTPNERLVTVLQECAMVLSPVHASGGVALARAQREVCNRSKQSSHRQASFISLDYRNLANEDASSNQLPEYNRMTHAHDPKQVCYIFCVASNNACEYRDV